MLNLSSKNKTKQLSIISSGLSHECRDWAASSPWSPRVERQPCPPASPGASAFSTASAPPALCILANFSAPQVHLRHPAVQKQTDRRGRGGGRGETRKISDWYQDRRQKHLSNQMMIFICWHRSGRCDFSFTLAASHILLMCRSQCSHQEAVNWRGGGCQHFDKGEFVQLKQSRVHKSGADTTVGDEEKNLKSL